MSVVFQRPYRFVPPHRGNWWPTLIQWLHLNDWHLRAHEGVVSYECRFGERFAQSLDRGDSILLAPNHCRYADPIVLGWLAREVGTHLYAVASWHLFNVSAFQSFALRRMGGFSIYREGADRQSLDTAIDILERAERPLIIFPEGTTNRTNDVLKPLLEGVAFIARTAARRRAKSGGGRVVIQPVGLKYLCKSDFTEWASEQLTELERRIGWRPPGQQTLLQRTLRLAEAMLSLREIESFGRSQSGDLRERRDRLMKHLLMEAERQLDLKPDGDVSVRERVRKIRSEAATRHFHPEQASNHGMGVSATPLDVLENAVASADLAQFLLSFPDRYLLPGQVTDTRIVETIQRIQEAMFGKASDTMPLHVVIEVGEPIPVPPEKPPRGETDPILVELASQLGSMIESLSAEARRIDDPRPLDNPKSGHRVEGPCGVPQQEQPPIADAS